MNYAKIRNYDIANGEGVRTSLFVSGCTNHCPGCFNPEVQAFDYGMAYTPDVEAQIIDMASDPVITGLSILGGDPLCQNADGLEMLEQLCYEVHTIGKTVWLWTGFIWENVIQESHKASLLTSCDIVVDGPFVEALAAPALVWRGSSNQRIIDVKKTIRQCNIVLWEAKR